MKKIINYLNACETEEQSRIFSLYFSKRRRTLTALTEREREKILSWLELSRANSGMYKLSVSKSRANL